MANIPSYHFSGSHKAWLDGEAWLIALYSNGTLRFDYDKEVEIGLIGGGAGGSYAFGLAAKPGGGGGQVKIVAANLVAGTGYDVTIGDGGAVNTPGGETSGFGETAAGGSVGAGGAAGGGKGADGTLVFGTYYGGYGGGGGVGGDGGLGKDNAQAEALRGAGGLGGGGKGAQGGAYYSYGGGAAIAGTPNTGGGGGGQGGGHGGEYQTYGGDAAAGGSGVIIIRGTGDDLLPVVCDGTRLTQMYFNGEKVKSLTVDGSKIF